MSLAQAVEKGPRLQSARAGHIQARIATHEARAKTLDGRAAAHRRKVKGDGALAKWHLVQAAALATAADRHHDQANRLREDLANAKAKEAKRKVKQVKRTVASTAAEGLVPVASVKPGKPAKTKRGQVAKPGRAKSASPSQPSQPAPSTRGTTVAVTGEVNDIEQAKANLDALETEIGELKTASDGMGGSFASLGLDNLSGALARIQDALDSAGPAIEDARDQLAKQEDIAEAAQNAGEMADAGFYGVG
jgi:hypothetical protein